MAQTTKAGSFILTAPTATIGGSASIDASLTAQLGPTALSLSAASVTTGATLAWTVYGPLDTDETAQIITAGSTSATPTWAAFTAAAGRIDGLWVVKCVVTKDASSTTYTRRVRVGDTDGYIHSHIATWANESAGAITTTRTVDSVVYTKNDSGTTDGTLTVGATGLVMDSNTDGVAIQWPATSGGSRTLLQSDDVVWYAATDASVGTNGDVLKLGLLNAAGTEVAQVEIGFTGGARRMVARRILAGTPSNYYKAEASHVRVIALRRIGAQSYEVRYSTTAYAGTWPLWSEMTAIIPGGTVSGRFTIKDNPPGDTGAGSTVTADPILWDATSVVRLAAVGTDRAIAATGIKWRPGA